MANSGQSSPKQIQIPELGAHSSVVGAKIWDSGVVVLEILEPVARWDARVLGYAYLDEEKFVDSVVQTVHDIGALVFELDPESAQPFFYIAP